MLIVLHTRQALGAPVTAMGPWLAEVRCQQGLDASVASLGLRMAALDLGWNNGPRMDVTEAWRDGFY